MPASKNIKPENCKKRIVLLLAVFAALTASAQKNIIYDGNAEKRNVTGFSGIKVSGGIDIYLTQGDEDGVAVSASDPKYRNHIITEVKDGILNIHYEQEGWHWNSGNKKMKAYISFRSIRLLKAAGASDVAINGTLKAEELDLNLSGASDMKGAVDIGKLTAHISGASDMNVTGKIESLKIDASGASDLKNYDLVVQTCDADVSGASDIRITVEKELNASASGASDVIIKGNAVIKKMSKSGASSIKKS